MSWLYVILGAASAPHAAVSMLRLRPCGHLLQGRRVASLDVAAAVLRASGARRTLLVLTFAFMRLLHDRPLPAAAGRSYSSREASRAQAWRWSPPWALPSTAVHEKGDCTSPCRTARLACGRTRIPAR